MKARNVPRRLRGSIGGFCCGAPRPSGDGSTFHPGCGSSGPPPFPRPGAGRVGGPPRSPRALRPGLGASGIVLRLLAQGGQVVHEARVGHGRRVHTVDLDALARGEAGDGAEHRDPVVARGPRSARPAGRRCPRTAKPSSVASASAPSPRRPSTTAAMRSDSFSRSSWAPRTTVSPSAKAPSSADQGQLVDGQRHLVRLDDGAHERAGGDVEVADGLARRDLVARLLLEVAHDDAAHPLDDPQEPACGSSSPRSRGRGCASP